MLTQFSASGPIFLCKQPPLFHSLFCPLALLAVNIIFADKHEKYLIFICTSGQSLVSLQMEYSIIFRFGTFKTLKDRHKNGKTPRLSL
jgi:hypothetical protein